MKKVISTPDAPQAIGPYSQAIVSNGTLYISGQIPLDPKTGEMCTADIKTQTRLVLTNIGAILKAAGCSYSDVVKTTCLLTDINDFAAMNEVYAEFFKENAPARSAFAVRDLPKGAKLEIETIAELDNSIFGKIKSGAEKFFESNDDEAQKQENNEQSSSSDSVKSIMDKLKNFANNLFGDEMPKSESAENKETSADNQNTASAETDNTASAETQNTASAETENTASAETENTASADNQNIENKINDTIDKTVNDAKNKIQNFFDKLVNDLKSKDKNA